jgi:hypothetical protein
MSPLMHNLIFIGIVILGLLCLWLLTPDYSKKEKEDEQSPILRGKNNSRKMPASASVNSAGLRSQNTSSKINQDVCQ